METHEFKISTINDLWAKRLIEATNREADLLVTQQLLIQQIQQLQSEIQQLQSEIQTLTKRYDEPPVGTDED